MQVYLVGGAVRDSLLGLPVKDKDFMVVGTDAATMKSLGFHQVGADFPVFLHPKTQAEYALARTERKSGNGYQGFSTNTQGVSLEEDLCRRDLTINALAIEVGGLFDDKPITGEILDFYGGKNDLQQKILRHVSPAFSEDPLRVLRVARFFARFAPLGFSIAPQTQSLMQEISSQDQLSHLSRERIWSETARALGETGGFLYFDCLRQLKILSKLLPSLDRLWQDDQVYQKTYTAVMQACQDRASLHLKFALICSGFDQGNSPDLKDVFDRLKPPKAISQFVKTWLATRSVLEKLPNLDAQDLLYIIEQTKAHKDETTLLDLLDMLKYWQNQQDVQGQALIAKSLKIYQAIGMADIDPTLSGAAIGQALYQKRLSVLTQFLSS